MADYKLQITVFRMKGHGSLEAVAEIEEPFQQPNNDMAIRAMLNRVAILVNDNAGKSIRIEVWLLDEKGDPIACYPNSQ